MNPETNDEYEYKTCPKCGGDLEKRRHRFSSDRGPNMPDADWKECEQCGYQTDPE